MSDELERQLREAQADLQILRDEFQEFAYIVSHDLIGAFRQVEGFAKIISSKHADDFDEKTQRHLSLILTGSENGKKILEALLEYSRLNTVPAKFAPVDCNAVVAEILSEMSTIIEFKQAVIKSVNLPEIIADKSLMKRLFHNLILNALAYSQAGRTPHISISSETSTLNQWTFLVEDNGMGIKDSQLDKIFKVLRRAVGKTHEDGTGQASMGMGLAIAKKIAALHGGDLSVDTEFGKGSTFKFTIGKALRRETGA